MRIKIKTFQHPRGIAKLESEKDIELQLVSSREFLLNHLWWAAKNNRTVHIERV